MWDLRKLKTPVHVFTGLPTTHSETGCCFSPDESLILTGISAQRDGTGGALLFFDVNKYASARTWVSAACMDRFQLLLLQS